MFSSRLERGHAPFVPKLAIKIAKNITQDVKMKMKEEHYLAASMRSANDTSDDISQFYRKELKYGRMLGSGAFCDVHELRSLVPDKKYENASEAKNYKSNRKKMTAAVKKSKKHHYVVKHLRSSLLKDQRDFHEAAIELILEAKYLTTLKHPNIISIHGVATAGGMAFSDGHHDAFFIVIDRLGSTLLDEVIKWKGGRGEQGKRLKVSLGKRLKMMIDLAGALEYLHDRNLVYRDLKPGNIGFDLNGNLRLFDFGLVAEVPKNGYLTQRSGTVRYMATDCFMGKYDCKADVFSFTVLMWEVLTLKHYFENKDNLEHVKATISGTREPLDMKWSTGLRTIFNEGWIGDPNKRPKMRELRNNLCIETGNSPSVHRIRKKPSKRLTHSPTFETVDTVLSASGRVSVQNSDGIEA
eukprot:CAMPEP_0194149454 /NCGR_PEP_ID=MMETSP0152-20130528/37955_1 /TAXON_ID=1049557 /ORGANISM="Thalassiothrix antarctica, Strain L6-D1" /LENGTH=410 /DNA_ID=CAMNT_0038851625 /DNA_START=100 /DNA_END=1332 /DNA_ORIENTATION=-